MVFSLNVVVQCCGICLEKSIVKSLFFTKLITDLCYLDYMNDIMKQFALQNSHSYHKKGV